MLNTLLSLGINNLCKVAKYRFCVKFGLYSLQKIPQNIPSGAFFLQNSDGNKDIDILLDKLSMFGYLKYPIQKEFPNWFYNPLTQKYFENITEPWYLIPDFNSGVGDIKGIWEISRFNWVLDLVLLERKRCDNLALIQLDSWLSHWCERNPAYKGPNWKCGQEASIRVMHLIAGLIGLNQFTRPSENIMQLIDLHLRRIESTIDYAIAQDNNHGTSEAAALFIGGALLNYITPQSEYKHWEDLGRKWLENRAKKLIMDDGGFSQYSVTYHRVMLDSYSLAEIVRQKLNLGRFSDKLYHRLLKATEWLYILTQENGDAPNIGANDGAHLLNVSGADYRDFRPCVQLASTLFAGHSYYAKPASYDEVLTFFALDKKELGCEEYPDKDCFFSQSGLVTGQKNNFFIAFKLPIFKFRPSQCDALHLDVWWNGQNLLRDGGTYSYNSTQDDLDYFSGVASHNTIQFDNHQQMPRLSRFLFGAWLKPSQLDYRSNQFSCAYKDYWGCYHKREVILQDKQIKVIDFVDNFQHQAVLRWRLQQGQWSLNENILSSDKIKITISSKSPLTIQLIQGEESKYYYQKQALPVLEVKVFQATSITTVIQDLT